MAAATPRLFNPLSNSQESLELDSQVGIYVCGITPYDTTHLGHAFTYTTYDVLVRFLRFLGHDVRYVQNITDIDDDVLSRAALLGVNWKELGDREVEKFQSDAQGLNNLPPDVNPRATEHMDDMWEMIESMLKRGAAYHSQGSVYFEVRKAASFGKRLFRGDYEAQLATANKHGNFPDDPAKKDPLDFVLWQGSKEGEPTWLSPWGPGRPGWHIECSAMSRRFLGDSFAIHGGGADLLFPHHECEIAQAEYSHGRLPASYWMHTGMVRYEGEKMSKSLGNMVFVADLLKNHSGNAVRLCLLSHHYRESWEYESSLMLEAGSLESRLAVLAREAGGASPEDRERRGGAVLEALSNDMQTPAALAALSRLAESADAADRRVARDLATGVFGLRWS